MEDMSYLKNGNNTNSIENSKKGQESSAWGRGIFENSPSPSGAFLAIDLKSFYASVECIERGLNPMTTNLVVADPSRTSRTICLAVSPSMKKYGIPGRPRLFEVERKIQEVNAARRSQIPDGVFASASSDARELEGRADLEVDYIVATPQMAKYMEISARIYQVYLKHVAPEDIHVYSIDEVFMDVSHYLKTYNLTAWELARRIILDVLKTTGITATAGIGTNLYLCKVAMDIEAKHIPPDENGVRIAQLDERSYREKLWTHRPLTSFWRVGTGYAKKLEACGIYTMGDIARCSMGKPGEYYNEDLLYQMFGVNAELLIDHAWGWEPCTIADIKAYKPASNSVGSGQVLHTPYPYEKAKLVVREMADMLALDLVEKGLVTDQLTLTVGYDMENLNDFTKRKNYKGKITTDRYGRKIPKHAHGTVNLEQYTFSARQITKAVLELFGQIVDPNLLARRLNLTANRVVPEQEASKQPQYEQMELFTDNQEQEEQKAREEAELEREKKMQQAVLSIKRKYGKNAILKGTSLQEGATARDRNKQIGGHKA